MLRVGALGGARRPGSAEDDGAAAVQQDAMLGVPADGAGERDPLGVAADGGQILRAVRVVDPGDLLLDDRALVQVGRDVVGGRADRAWAWW